MAVAARASLPEIHRALKDWIVDRVRIDRWSLDNPTVLATEIDGVRYPANVALSMPAQEVSYEQGIAGVECTATMRFQIKYRFSKLLSFDSLPVPDGEALLNNLYFEAINRPGSIHPSIKTVNTPDSGIDLMVARTEDPTDSDWLLVLNPDFRIRFNAALADLSGLQPVDEETPVIVRRLDIGIYRSPVGSLPDEKDDARLDRFFSID